MRQIFLQILLLITTAELLKSQDAGFSLTGKVTDCQTNKSIKGVKLKLLCSDGRSLETISDSAGNYIFDSSIIKENRQYIVSTQTEMDLGYLNSSDKFKFGAFDSIAIRNIQKDFCLSKNEGCTLRLPLLRYEKNSVTTYTFDQDVFNFDFLKEMMLDNPTFVVEIAAHNSIDEKNPLKLSEKRVEYLKNILIQKGVSKDRLVMKIYGNEKPIITTEEIKQLKTDREKEDAYKKNRRVIFNIVRKDYLPTKELNEIKPSH
jgi:hypothetical protein